MPKSALPRKARTLKRVLDWGRSYANFKRFFDTFDYSAFNARKRAADRAHEQIHYRRANIRSAAQTLFRLAMDGAKRKARPGEATRFTVLTFRSSLATLLDRTTRSIDRYLDALRDMLFLEERRRTGRALELALAASLFVYLDAGEPRHTPPVSVTAAAEATPTIEANGDAVALDPKMLAAIEQEEIRQRVLASARAKKGESSPEKPFHPPSRQSDTY